MGNPIKSKTTNFGCLSWRPWLAMLADIPWINIAFCGRLILPMENWAWVPWAASRWWHWWSPFAPTWIEINRFMLFNFVFLVHIQGMIGTSISWRSKAHCAEDAASEIESIATFLWGIKLCWLDIGGHISGLVADRNLLEPQLPHSEGATPLVLLVRCWLCMLFVFRVNVSV